MSATDIDGLLDVLCPMHLVIDRGGRILRAGPTLAKVLGLPLDPPPLLLDLFDVRRPLQVATHEDLLAVAGQRIRLRAKKPPYLDLKGILMPGLPDEQVVVNLSFGIGVVRAVQDFQLTAADFAVTDLAVEMLYLVEAKSAAMEASRQLNKKLEIARETAEHQALTDPLTGLSNRRAMDAALSKLVWAREPFALLHLDLDYFKSINDTHGHAAGDFVLTSVAGVLRSETRTNDLVARLGGDEFVIILSKTVERGIISQIATRIVDRVSQPMIFAGKTCQVSASIGIAVSSDYHLPDADMMAADADLALYTAKRAGRGCHMFYGAQMRMAAEPTSAELSRARNL
jgi:diguanylate cyclase (GGDEF)-like protein